MAILNERARQAYQLWKQREGQRTSERHRYTTPVARRPFRRLGDQGGTT